MHNNINFAKYGLSKQETINNVSDIAKNRKRSLLCALEMPNWSLEDLKNINLSDESYYSIHQADG